MAHMRTKNTDLTVLVDDNKLEELSQFDWRINSKDHATTRINGKEITMHKYLTNCPKGMQVFHKNLKRLDNRLENLEIVSQGEWTRKHNQFTKERERDEWGYLTHYNTSVQRGEE